LIDLLLAEIFEIITWWTWFSEKLAIDIYWSHYSWSKQTFSVQKTSIIIQIQKIIFS